MAIKTETSTETITKHKWVCDICGKEMTMGCSKHTCDICGCDVCFGCAHEVDEYYHYCPHCWEIAQYEQEQTRHNAVNDAIMCEWKQAVVIRND
jgi:hypothetical protein